MMGGVRADWWFICFGYALIGWLLVLFCCFSLGVLGAFEVVCEVCYDTLFKICAALGCGWV